MKKAIHPLEAKAIARFLAKLGNFSHNERHYNELNKT